MRDLGCDLVDEHFYSSESFFENNATRYDNYPREGTKVFAGEYACHGADGKKLNHFNAALVESAFMTGLERNADVVYMATYAPLLAHVKGWQWRPDLVWFDNTRIMRSCSYYVQQLYSLNKGDYVLPALVDGKPLTGQQQLYASAVVQGSEIIVKITNLSRYSQTLNIELDGLQGPVTGGTLTTLYSSDAMAENTLDNPDKVVPVTVDVDMAPCLNPQDYWQKGWYTNEQGDRVLKTSVAGSTFSVFKFKIR